jgi:hypothetical protein
VRVRITNLKKINFAVHIAYKGDIILLVSPNPLHTLVVESAAKEAGPYLHACESMEKYFNTIVQFLYCASNCLNRIQQRLERKRKRRKDVQEEISWVFPAQCRFL